MQGRQLACSVSAAFYNRTSKTGCVEGRPFAMMAAQGLDVLWTRFAFPVIFFVVAASGSNQGTLRSAFSVFDSTVSVSGQWIGGLTCSMSGSRLGRVLSSIAQTVVSTFPSHSRVPCFLYGFSCLRFQHCNADTAEFRVANAVSGVYFFIFNSLFYL